VDGIARLDRDERSSDGGLHLYKGEVKAADLNHLAAAGGLQVGQRREQKLRLGCKGLTREADALL